MPGTVFSIANDLNNYPYQQKQVKDIRAGIYFHRRKYNLLEIGIRISSPQAASSTKGQQNPVTVNQALRSAPPFTLHNIVIKSSMAFSPAGGFAGL